MGIRAGMIAMLLVGLSVMGSSTLRAQAPSIEIDEAGRWVLTRLPPVLDREEVAPQLTRGLTTTFVFVVDLVGVRDDDQAGGARIEIRYELWDELFDVVAMGVDGRPMRAEIASMEELREWWGEVRIAVVDRAPTTVEERVRARVRLDIVPFSQSEQVDTQRWFAKSVSSAELARSEGLSTAVDGSEDQTGGVLSVLIATSIRRRPMTSLRWTVTPSSSPPP